MMLKITISLLRDLISSAIFFECNTAPPAPRRDKPVFEFGSTWTRMVTDGPCPPELSNFLLMGHARAGRPVSAGFTANQNLRRL
jgi:hypothetical protein